MLAAGGASTIAISTRTEFRPWSRWNHRPPPPRLWAGDDRAAGV